MENNTERMESLLAYVTRNGEAKSYIQIRIYDLQDCLIFKRLALCSDYLKLCQDKDEYFSDRNISRCTVRYLDARRLDWRVIIRAINKQASTFNPRQTPAEKWRITYYDIADEIQAQEESERIFKFDTVNLTMKNQNSVYSVLSACEAGEPDGRFRIFCSIDNEHFHFEVVDADGNPTDPPVKPPISLFKNAIIRDIEETKRLEMLLYEEFRSE